MNHEKYRIRRTWWLLTVAWMVLPFAARAQKTLFNVPEAEIVEKNHLFFQQQISVTDKLQSGTTFTYGLGGGWEVGLNIHNLTGYYEGRHDHLLELNSDQPDENPSLLVNVQKEFDVREGWFVGLGTRVGPGYLGKPANVKLSNFSYLVNEFKIGERDIELLGGGYYATPTFIGEGTNVGYMLGALIPLVDDKLNFEAEYISGTSSFSNFIAGFMYQFASGWQLSLGAQIPSPGSRNPYGLTVQVNTP